MRLMKRHLALAAVLASFAPAVSAAETNSHSMKMPHMSMAHMHKAQQGCGELTLACATTVTPFFASDGALWIAARAGNRIFDGTKTNLMLMTSHDDGASFGPLRVVSSTTKNSDHPILVKGENEVFLSWQTQEGYRLISVGDAS